MLSFYKEEGFSLFPCNLDKLPKVKSWKSTQEHLNTTTAERIMVTGGFIGAWLPEDYIIIDIDMNHKDREGKPKPDGMKPFKELCSTLKITKNLLNETLVVKTGSGGFHLYFKVPENCRYTEISQRKLAESVDVRTHAGYVIAAGTNGYIRITDKEPITIPFQLWDYLKEINEKKASRHTPARMLPVSMLKKVLDKLNVKSFDDNDSWQEFITAAIATSGNSEEVLDVLEEWSRSDSSYTGDNTIRRRIETFEPNGAITAGTFIYILKKEDVSKYIIDKVRIAVGAEFNFAQKFAENYPPPFKVDFSLIHEHRDLIGAFYYRKHQTSGLAVFVALVKDNLLYCESEKKYYYYNGNYWVESSGVQLVILSVLLNAGQRFYSDIDKKNADSFETVSEYINYLGSIATIQRFESALKTYPEITRKSVPWDSPELEATLTLKDCVMDFSVPKTLTFRKGLREEYRRLFIDLEEKDFENKEIPVKFREFLKDVFPDGETRKTATYVLSTMLSGTGRFRKFHIWNGSGNNGKSSLMEIMTSIIGEDRTATYSPGILLSSGNQSSLTPELAALRGSLVAFSSETNEAKKVSEGAIKNLTGDESITANPKYQGMITFKTTFQLVLSTNYLPRFSAHDNAFVNRLLILPFHTCFYDTNEKKERGKLHGSRYFKEAKNITKIKEGIQKERAQVLYYLARRYQELDLNIPESGECLEAKSHYIKDNNDILDMIHDILEFDEGRGWFTPTKDLIDYYNAEQHTKCSQHTVMTRVKQVFPLVESHSKRVNGKLARGWKNIRFKYGVYPEGYMGSFTDEEIQNYLREEANEREIEGIKEAQF